MNMINIYKDMFKCVVQKVKPILLKIHRYYSKFRFKLKKINKFLIHNFFIIYVEEYDFYNVIQYSYMQVSFI